MSLVFSDTSTKKGVIQTIERKLGFNDGDISGNTQRLKDFTAEINLTIDEMLGFLFPRTGSWQLDDSNQTDYPIIRRNIESGVRDYTFTTDGSSNIILDIWKVTIADSSGIRREILPADQQTRNSGTAVNVDTFIDGQNSSGTPYRYDKTGNGIFLDPVPNYNYTNGIEVYINREATYFTTANTTKKLGFAHLFHEYLAIRPAAVYAALKTLPNAVALQNERIAMRQAIMDYFGSREKDVRGRLVANRESNK